MQDNLANKLKRQVYGRKITGYVILGAIGLVFVFFGYGGGGPASMMGVGYAARVNNTLISVADFQQEASRIEQYYASMFGGQFAIGNQRTFLQQQAMQSLVRSELVYQGARNEGIYATDSEVRDFIVSSIPAFQENGVFMRDRYMSFLQGSRATPADFENKVRKDIANIRTRSLVEAAARPSSLELALQKRLSENKLNVQFVRLSDEELARKIKVNPSEVDARLAEEAFVQRARDYFTSHRSDWVKSETAEAQHILVAFQGGDAASEQKALEKARQLKTRSQKEDFGKLASEHSDDPGSKSKRGQLGAFSRGNMVKEFEDAAFSLPLGQVSDPVKTQYGYHLIKVSARTPAKNPSFEDVKKEVATRVVARDQAEAQLKVLDEAVAKGDLAAIDQTLRGLGVSWEETGFFELGADAAPKLPQGPVSEAVFELSPQKPILNRVLRESGQRFVLRFKELRTEPSKDASTMGDDILQRRRADGIYGQWLEGYRAASSVEMNGQIIERPQ